MIQFCLRVPALPSHLSSQQLWFLLSAYLAPAEHSQDREIPHQPLGTGSSAWFCDAYIVAMHLHVVEIVAESVGIAENMVLFCSLLNFYFGCKVYQFIFYL